MSSVANIRYRSASVIAPAKGGHSVALSAESAPGAGLFYQGQLKFPRTTARALACLSRVVAERWFDAAAVAASRQMDPVVTSGAGRVRFEGFSGCRSLYARVDLLPGGQEMISESLGTTNVDFNTQMRTTLGAIRKDDAVSLAIGVDAFTLVHGVEAVVEKKVTLPDSWVRGFCSMQSLLAAAERRIEMTRAQALAFLRSVPRQGDGREVHQVAFDPRGARIVRHAAGDDVVRLSGARRLSVLQDMIAIADKLEIHSDPAGQFTCWTLHFPPGLRLTLVLSAEVWRGFSGEGAALEDLGRASDDALVRAVLDHADAEPVFDAEQLAMRLNLDLPQLRTALAVLASQGLLGFDHCEQRWFRRVLPESFAKVEASNPRLGQARKLVAEGKVEIADGNGSELRAIVRAAHCDHQVLIRGGEQNCTCYWHSRFGISRGACSHLLAAKLATQK